VWLALRKLANAELSSGIIKVANEPSKNIARMKTGKIHRGSLGLGGNAFAMRISGGSFLCFVVESIGHSE